MKTTITTEQITSAGHELEQAAQVRALCSFLDCQPDDLSLESYDHYGLSRYSYGQQEYAIGEDSECDTACEKYCEDSAWAFNADFIISQCGLPLEMVPAIRAMQEKQCEGANDAIVALVEKCGNGFSGSHSFSEAAISADGRGHFLSGYDGEENEESGGDSDGNSVDFYIYRLN